MSEVMWVWDYELKTLGSWPSTGYNGHNTPVEVVTQMDMKALRDERDRLVLHLDAALDHAQQYNEGCLYCGEGEIIDGETTPEHQAECWWYRAKAALTPAGQRWTREGNT